MIEHFKSHGIIVFSTHTGISKTNTLRHITSIYNSFFLDISGSGLRVWMPNPIPCGSPVKVESKQMVMVGEVGRCQADGEGYVVGLMVFHSEPIAAP